MFKDKDYVLINGTKSNLNNNLSLIKSFYMCIHQVTQKEYVDVMGYNPSTFVSDFHPVESVTWFSCVLYCNMLSKRDNLKACYSIKKREVFCNFDLNGYRLPTEKEWEYAAKGGDLNSKILYSGSNEIEEVGWYYDNKKIVGTHDVMLKKPNALGIFDMTGNVWEWCWDWYSENQKLLDFDIESNCKVTRGGCFGDYKEGCYISYRGISNPLYANQGTGFRLVRSIS